MIHAWAKLGAQWDDDVPRVQRGAGRSGQQWRVEQEVRIVHERHMGALGGKQPLERASGVEASEPTAGDHDLPSHEDRIWCRP